MKKLIYALLLTTSSFITFSQVSKMVSDSAYFVMEVDLGKIIKSVPLEEINQLDFVQSLLKDFKNDSLQINDLSDVGINFNSKLVFFTVEREGYSSESVVVPIKNKEKFIQTFNPQQQNTLLKKGKMERDGKLITLTQTTCVMSNIDWKLNSFREEARLIFEENKWELPNNYNYFSPYEDTETTEEEMMRQMFEEYNNEIREDNEGEFYEDNVVSQQELKQIKLEKKFQRVLDSLKTIKKSAIIRYHHDFIKGSQVNLYTVDKAYQKMSQQTADAKIFLNPLMNYAVKDEYKYHPLQKFIDAELTDMRQFAFINFTSDGIHVDWKIQVSENVAQLMKAAQSRKIDRKLLKYIPENAQGVGVYNINTFGAYNKLKEIYMPQLDSSENENELFASAVWSTIDEFIDMEAAASVYPPKIVFSYSGFKEMALTKSTYQYDEETFEYTEVDTICWEKMPVVTMALSNKNAYLLEKYMKAFSHSEGFQVSQKDNYYTFRNSTTFNMPFHLAIIDDIILLTNDESTVKNHLKGFSSKGFDRKIRRKIKKAKLFYAHFDFEQLSRNIADLGILKNTKKYNELFNDKTGKMNVEISSITKKQAHYVIDFKTKEEYKNGGYFLFQLLNALYLYNK